MIIVEGSDGSGKTTLIKRLVKEFGLPIHARASDSEKGPVDNIFDWGVNDLRTREDQPLSIYDRHPMISEPIYGPICRGRIDPRFESEFWMTEVMYHRALVILCLPPFHIVEHNVTQGLDPQMNGVDDNIADIYLKYSSLLDDDIFLESAKVVYDYTKEEDYDCVKFAVEQHVEEWKREREFHLHRMD